LCPESGRGVVKKALVFFGKPQAFPECLIRR